MVAVVASRSVRLGVGRILRRRSSIYSTIYQCDSALIAWSEDGSERLESQGIKVSTRIIGCDCRNGVEAIPRIQAIPCWLVSWNLVHIPNPPFLVAQIFQPPGWNLVGFGWLHDQSSFATSASFLGLSRRSPHLLHPRGAHGPRGGHNRAGYGLWTARVQVYHIWPEAPQKTTRTQGSESINKTDTSRADENAARCRRCRNLHQMHTPTRPRPAFTETSMPLPTS